MKIALVSMRFDQKGGSERRTYQLAKGLVSRGHDVEIFAARTEDLDIDAKVNDVPVSFGPSFVKVASFASNVRAILAKRPDIDVVHNQIRPFTDGIVTVGGGCHAEYLERSGKRLSLLNPLHRVVIGMERERYRPGGCKAVITNSEFAKRGILKHYPMPPEMVHVVYNGVDVEKFHPKRIRTFREEIRTRYGLSDELLLLFVGSGFERKGLATVIRALSLTRNRHDELGGTRLLVVGKDNPRPYMRLSARLGVSDRVVFAGRTASPESFYGSADIYALPTLYDPFSNASFEAMACGLPVITSAYNGVSEIIEDGVNGFVMGDPYDPEELAAMLLRLSSREDRDRVGGLARAAVQGYTWEKTLEATLAVYGSARI